MPKDKELENLKKLKPRDDTRTMRNAYWQIRAGISKRFREEQEKLESRGQTQTPPKKMPHP